MRAVNFVAIFLISAALVAASSAAQLTPAETAEISLMCGIISLLEGIVSLIILLIILLGGVLYAVSHMMGAQQKQNLQSYALGMVVGGVAGLIVVIIAQYLLGYFVGQISGAAQCPTMSQTNSATLKYYTVTLDSNPSGSGAALSASSYSVQAGNYVSICANEPANYWQWEGWTGTASLGNSGQMCTGFNMPASDVQETANWWPCVYVYANSQCSGGTCGAGSVGVQGGSSSGSASGGNSGTGSNFCAPEGSTVTLTASAESGSHLCSWTGAGNGGNGVCSTTGGNSCSFTLHDYTREEGTFLPSSQAC